MFIKLKELQVITNLIIYYSNDEKSSFQNIFINLDIEIEDMRHIDFKKQ